jgi:deoxyribodipyrimidine photolyase
MILGLFIFRRDLRIVDNIALNELSKVCDMIIPIFILDPYQIYKQDHNQYYFSNNAL